VTAAAAVLHILTVALSGSASVISPFLLQCVFFIYGLVSIFIYL
jgi:hypothetical protein